MHRLLALFLAACGTSSSPPSDAGLEDPPKVVTILPPDDAASTTSPPCGALRDLLTGVPLPCKPYDARTDLGRPLP